MRKKGFTGNRYSQVEKRRIAQYVRHYDSKNGRGGIAAAQKKFQVSYIALRNWLAGAAAGRKKGLGLKPVLERLSALKVQVRDIERHVRRLQRTVSA